MRASLGLVLLLVLAGCATPGAPPPVPHDDADLGLPVVKRPFDIPEWLPEGYLAYDANDSRVFERAIHGTRVVVAIHEDLLARSEIGGHDVRPPEELATFFFETFEAAWHVFGGHLHDEARVVLKGPDEPCDFDSATAVGFPVCYRDHAHTAGDATRPPHPLTTGMIPELFAHEWFHMWNGGAFHAPPRNASGFPPEAWWFEGATTYYAARLSGEPERAMAAERAKAERLSASVGGLSFEELAARSPPPRSGPSDHVDMLYARGALVTELLDAELDRHGSSVDALARALYVEFALADRTVEMRDFETTAERVAGADLSAFFDAYVWGAAPIPPS